MRAIVATVTVVFGFAMYAGARAEDPDVLAPYRFNPAPKEMTPLDRQRAEAYRQQVQKQLKDLELDEARGLLRPADRRDLLDTRTEANRMNRVTSPPSAGPVPMIIPPQPGTLPSLTPGPGGLPSLR